MENYLNGSRRLQNRSGEVKKTSPSGGDYEPWERPTPFITPGINLAAARSFHNYIESLGSSITYTYNWSTRGYEKNGQSVPYNEVYNKAILPNSDTYLIYETAYLNDEGKWVGNGNYGIVKQGKVVSDGRFPSFHSYTDASNYISNLRNVSNEVNEVSLSDLAPEQDFSGFYGQLKYLFTCGNVDGWHYNRNGEPIGPAPTYGIPPVPGKFFRGGSKILRDGYLTSKPKAFQRWFHRVWKEASAPNSSKSEIDEALELWKKIGKPHPK